MAPHNEYNIQNNIHLNVNYVVLNLHRPLIIIYIYIYIYSDGSYNIYIYIIKLTLSDCAKTQ